MGGDKSPVPGRAAQHERKRRQGLGAAGGSEIQRPWAKAASDPSNPWVVSHWASLDLITVETKNLRLISGQHCTWRRKYKQRLQIKEVWNSGGKGRGILELCTVKYRSHCHRWPVTLKFMKLL